MIEKRTFGGIVADIIIWIIVGALALSCLMPLMNIVAISLSDNAAVSANLVNIFPIGFNISSYQEIMGDKQFWRSFGISVLRVVLGLSVNITLLVLTAYPLSKSPKFFTGQKVYMSLILFAMLFSGGLIPTFMVVNSLKLTNTIWALIIPSLLMNAFHVMLVRNYFSTSIPESLIESAKLDGASEMMIFRAIVLPLSKPIMATIGLMLALSYWNNWTNGLYYLDDTSLYSIQNVLNAINNNIIAINSVSNMGLAINKSEVPALTARMAIAVIGIVPMLCIYPFFQKYFVKGITIGAVKG